MLRKASDAAAPIQNRFRTCQKVGSMGAWTLTPELGKLSIINTVKAANSAPIAPRMSCRHRTIIMTMSTYSALTPSSAKTAPADPLMAPSPWPASRYATIGTATAAVRSSGQRYRARRAGAAIPVTATVRTPPNVQANR
jgi:hypothetical protein